MNSYEEKRKFPRLDVKFSVMYQVNGPIEAQMIAGIERVDALMLDLSESGMAIVTDYDIPPATVMLLKFTLVNRKANQGSQSVTIEILGEVCYNVVLKSGEHRLGISFKRIDNEDKAAIAEFVKVS